MLNREKPEIKAKSNKYMITICIATIILLAAVIPGLFINSQAELTELPIALTQKPETSSKPENILEQDIDDLPPPSLEEPYIIRSLASRISAYTLDDMINWAEVVVTGSFIELEGTMNTSRDLEDSRIPTPWRYHRGKIYLFQVDELLKGNELQGEVYPNVIRIVVPHFELRAGYICNTVIAEDGTIIEEPTEFDPFSVELIRDSYIEPVIGETVMMFLRAVDRTGWVEGIDGAYALWGQPNMIAITPDGIAELRSNFTIPLNERQPQIFHTEGEREIWFMPDSWVLEDTITGLHREEILDVVEEVTGISAFTGAASNVAGSSAVLNASVGGDTGAVEHGFYWGTTNNPSNRVVAGTSRTAVRNFSFNLEGLAPETTYFFRAFAGTTQGGVMSFVTDATAQPPVTITWNAMGGSVWPATQQLIPGTPFGALPTPSMLQHTFNGWWTTASGAGTQIHANSIVPNSNTTFFARWTFDSSGLSYCHWCGAFALLDEGWRYECFACGAWAIINPREQLD